MRTDNLASRRTKINNARGLVPLSLSLTLSLASPSQIVASHTRYMLVTCSCIVLVNSDVLLAHGGCYGGIETPSARDRTRVSLQRRGKEIPPARSLRKIKIKKIQISDIAINSQTIVDFGVPYYFILQEKKKLQG